MQRTIWMFGISLFSSLLGVYWHWGAQSTSFDHLAERWGFYAQLAAWGAATTFVVAVVDWFLQELVAATEERVRAEIMARNVRDLRRQAEKRAKVFKDLGLDERGGYPISRP